MNQKILHFGLDVGSTTIKTVIIDENDKIIYSSYNRHFSEVRKVMAEDLLKALEQYPDSQVTLAVAGSGGISAAKNLGASFVQEVVAGAEAIRRFMPRTDVAIELGGEDAKLTFFDAGIDQRMNESCAGGTGAFIDQMASFLKTDPPGLNELAKRSKTIYPIAARCGVFAKTDILPLLNEGAAKEDIAASIFQAVVDQTIGGLACGRAIRGQVAFLGGPLFFLSELRKRFIETLKLSPQEAICPAEAQIYVALGTALYSKKNVPQPASTWINKINQLKAIPLVPEVNPLPPLFEDMAQMQTFHNRHDKNRLPRANWPENGNIFLGIDAGSTTTKLVAIDENCNLLHSFYNHNRGNPLKSVIGALTELFDIMPPNLKVTQSGVTGYGESLIQSALHMDLGEVETVAHYKAAAFFEPNVSFIVDIGGQDIKCLSVKNGVIDRLMLNEACSSGCGSFLETFAKTLGMDAPEFAKVALTASNPVDLGSRCTVFMNSKVKQAQKEGAPVGDISAGLSYSVVKNALYKVIRIARPEELGEKVVVQGGTFFNDAVLRAFELSIGLEVIRPDIAGLMGAFGAAILAKEQWLEFNQPSKLISKQQLAAFSAETTSIRCNKCSNRCLLTINRFSDGRNYVSGNRCERGAIIKPDTANKIDSLAKKANLGDITPKLAKIPVLNSLSGAETKQEFNELPNLFKWNLYRLFDVYKPRPASESRGRVALLRALGTYENYPFWFTFFHQLGFSVELTPFSTKKIFNKALDTIPSQTVCYPAKLVHGHALYAAEQRPDFIFFPAIPLDIPTHTKNEGRYNCPIVAGYSEVIRLNMDALHTTGVRFVNPFLDLINPSRLAKRLTDELSFLKISKNEIKKALKSAYKEQEDYEQDIKSAGERALAYLKNHNKVGVVLAGHHYHMDPEVHHGISDIITANGLAVLTASSISHLAPDNYKLRVTDQWVQHSKIYRSAMVVASREDLELVQLNSFGCGLDAITTDQVEEILEHAGKVYTLLKIDEGSNLGAARIRIRSLLAARNERRRSKRANSSQEPYIYEPPRLKKDELEKYTLLCPQMSPSHWQFLVPAFKPSGYNLEILPNMNHSVIDEGLRFVNNDACYPALVSIGQLLEALKSGKYDLDRTAVIMSQTGGGCRATNYVAFLQRALKLSNMSQVAVWPFSIAQGQNRDGFENLGAKIDHKMMQRIIIGLLYGDMLNRLLLATRPYEKKPGIAQNLFDYWSKKAIDVVYNNNRAAFNKHIIEITRDFNNLDLYPPDKPKVAIVGEIFVNYHPGANNQVAELVEKEGAQVVMPELVDFFLYCLYDDIFRADFLSGSVLTKWLNKYIIATVEKYRAPMRKALALYPRFGTLHTFNELKEAGSKIVSLGNQTGEGWYLAADMVLLLKNGINNILCLQPFGCLPNHITGKGVVKTLKDRFPNANMVAVDYDPGSSEVNQLNRIKLMMSVALENNSIIESQQNNQMFSEQKTNI